MISKIIPTDDGVCENVSVQFSGEELDHDDVKEAIGTYAYVGKLKGSDTSVYWKRTENSLPENKQLFIYQSGSNLIFQVGFMSHIDYDISGKQIVFLLP